MTEFMQFVTAHPYFAFYAVGCVFAFILSIIQALIEKDKGEDIGDFPMAVTPLTFFSWVYVYVFFEQIVFKKNR